MKRFAIAILSLTLTGIPAVARAMDLPFNGYLNYSMGARLVDDPTAPDDFLLNETRFQLDIIHDADAASMEFRADFVNDRVLGNTYIDIREAYVQLTPTDSIDLKVGTQIFTWGTGDFVFLNDLFPKDWQSYFIGRADEYLKKPADGIRATWYGDSLNLDLVWMPVFQPDAYISGERISYWGGTGKTGPANGPINPVEPDRTMGNSQWAARLYGTFGGVESALYAYRGNYGTPKGFDTVLARPFFPRLEAWGASAQSAIFGGIGNAEVAWYNSLDDAGPNDFLPNSEVRGLLGFSHDIARDQTLGVQAYLEHADDFPDVARTDQDRWWVTLRYTGLFMQQNLILSWFSFYSPNEKDFFLRPKATYKVSDEVTATMGGNIFLGKDDNTFFGQFDDNTNVYASLEYSF